MPDGWKEASVILIPKPGKPLNLENMRLISLTLCIGKVMEHVILNRVSGYIEHMDLFPHNIVGFQPGLSTQEVMVMLKKQIFDSGTRDVRGTLALDLTKAFDRVLHGYMLHATAGIGLGVKLQAFVRSFLMNRTATILVGQIRSSVYELGARGSVVSPLLFNIVMKGHSERLSGLAGIGHVLYADDITIWCPGGSLAEMEQALQAALDETEAHLAETGLKVSPSKSELLLYRPARQGVRGLTPLNPAYRRRRLW